MTFHIITLFPESLGSYLESSIVGRALKNKQIKIKFYNPRDFAASPKGKSKKEWFYRQTDDKAYGGGPGMVLQAEPILRAVDAALRASHRTLPDREGKSRLATVAKAARVVIFTPSGKPFTNLEADIVAKKSAHLILICGRYEGIDARVKKVLKAQGVKVEERSVGPYVLTGGELPALVVLDAVTRRLPGVLGKDESVEERRVSSSEIYTRPEVLPWRGKNYRVPKVLLSGNHQKIEAWRQKRSK